ncbi:two-component system response regulator [Methanosarcinales archaeon]|nr:MAG: two-component system response regulator [Methanosarcinales archaeon]
MEKQKKRILIVEDAPYMCEMIEEMLNSDEYEIADIAVNGIEAVRKYKELEPKPDIVTMDIVMEEMDGIQATKEIKKYDPDALIIVISALGTPEHKKAALEAGADEYLWKPFTVKNLSELFEKQLAVKKGQGKK